MAEGCFPSLGMDECMNESNRIIQALPVHIMDRTQDYSAFGTPHQLCATCVCDRDSARTRQNSLFGIQCKQMRLVPHESLRGTALMSFVL